MKNQGPKSLADGNQAPSESSHGLLPIFQRAVVHDILNDPTSLSDDEIEALKVDVRFTNNIRNLPRNSIVAERIMTGRTEISGREIFFPMFSPHIGLPLKPGEQVWVMFEDPDMINAQGFWVSRICEVRDVDDVNFTHADRKFDRRNSTKTSDKGLGKAPPTPGFDNGSVGTLNGSDVNMKGTASISGGADAYNSIAKKARANKQFEPEVVPRFTKRPADTLIQGSNNTLIVLGTDRTGAAGDSTGEIPAADERSAAGTVIISAGRGKTDKTLGKKIKNSRGRFELDKSRTSETKSEGNFDFENDASTLVVSMQTRADRNFAIKNAAIKGSSAEPAAAIVVKSTQVRIVAREDIKLLVKAAADTPDSECAMVVIKKTGDIVFVPSEKGVIKLGGDDANVALLGTHAGVTNTSGKVSASPIVDTMGGSQGGSDGLNGVFATKVLAK